MPWSMRAQSAADAGGDAVEVREQPLRHGLQRGAAIPPPSFFLHADMASHGLAAAMVDGRSIRARSSLFSLESSPLRRMAPSSWVRAESPPRSRAADLDPELTGERALRLTAQQTRG